MVRWKLKQVIADKKLSMKQVALLSGVSYSQIKRFCRNPHQDATVYTLGKLADALDVSFAELIESEQYQKPMTTSAEVSFFIRRAVPDALHILYSLAQRR